MKTVQVYHGGYKFSRHDGYEPSNKKDRFEHGAGLYCTPKWELAEKYSRGSRIMYTLTVELDPAGDVDAIKIPMQDAVQFLNSIRIGAALRKQIKESCVKFNDNGMVPLWVINNNLINAGTMHKHAKAFNTFVVEHGGKYCISRSMTGAILCIYDFKIITAVEKASTYHDFSL